MKYKEIKVGEYCFIVREGYSDEKAIKDVIINKCYERPKSNFLPKQNENWLDAGGNIGAFAVWAASKGAIVTVYEPDPYNCEMIEKNLKKNGLKATIINKALVHNSTQEMILFIGNNNQVWRNSLCKKWNNKGIKVKCANFFEVYKYFDCCKMDIEGSEMSILENVINSDYIFEKLVFEWSFDIDRNIERCLKCISALSHDYLILNPVIQQLSKYLFKNPPVKEWTFNPAAVNVFCVKK